MSFAHSRHGDIVRYSVAPEALLFDRASFVMAFASACNTYQCVSPTSSSQGFGKPEGVPLKPSAMIIRSRTMSAPTCFRVQCDSCAHSAAMRKYARS